MTAKIMVYGLSVKDESDNIKENDCTQHLTLKAWVTPEMVEKLKGVGLHNIIKALSEGESI